MKGRCEIAISNDVALPAESQLNAPDVFCKISANMTWNHEAKTLMEETLRISVTPDPGGTENSDRMFHILEASGIAAALKILGAESIVLESGSSKTLTYDPINSVNTFVDVSVTDICLTPIENSSAEFPIRINFKWNPATSRCAGVAVTFPSENVVLLQSENDIEENDVRLEADLNVLGNVMAKFATDFHEHTNSVWVYRQSLNMQPISLKISLPVYLRGELYKNVDSTYIWNPRRKELIPWSTKIRVPLPPEIEEDEIAIELDAVKVLMLSLGAQEAVQEIAFEICDENIEGEKQ